MTVVIDVGCATHGGDTSLPVLWQQFQPDFLVGFDPAAGDQIDWGEIVVPDGALHVRREAAWTYDGVVRFVEAGLGGHVTDEKEGRTTRCVDLARFILFEVPEGEEIILKLDCEGAEYELVPHLVATNADLRLTKALIEWHCAECGMGIWNQDMHREGCPADKAAWIARRDGMIASLRCEVEAWAL